MFGETFVPLLLKLERIQKQIFSPKTFQAKQEIHFVPKYAIFAASSSSTDDLENHSFWSSHSKSTWISSRLSFSISIECNSYFQIHGRNMNRDLSLYSRLTTWTFHSRIIIAQESITETKREEKCDRIREKRVMNTRKNALGKQYECSPLCFLGILLENKTTSRTNDEIMFHSHPSNVIP